MADSTSRFGSANASAFPELVDERHHVEVRRCRAVGALVRPHDRQHRDPVLGRERRDTPDHLARGAGVVEASLAGDHQVGAVEVVVEVELVGDQLEARQQRPTECSQRAPEPARSAAAGDRGDVDAEVVAEHLRHPVQTPGEQCDLCRGGALLRPEDLCCVGEGGRDVARDQQFDLLEAGNRRDRPDGSEAAVGGRRAAESDDDPASTGVERVVDQLAGARGGGVQRIVARRAADQRHAARPSHLDDRRSLRQAPLGAHGIAERPGHGRGAIRPAERVEQAVTAVGHRHLGAVDAQLPARVPDRGGDLGGAQRALELVGSGDDATDRATAHRAEGHAGDHTREWIVDRMSRESQR